MLIALLYMDKYFHNKNHPVYTISIAAQLVGCHPRMLRIYEERGLIKPRRRHNIRLYSQQDIELINEICDLMDKWSINLSGVNALFKMADRFHIKLEKLLEEMLGE
jgi:MerR family transcriptional regulator, heat shock protein HspR